MKLKISKIGNLVAIFAAFFSITSFANAINYPTQMIQRPGIMPTGMAEFNSNLTLEDSKNLGLDIKSDFGITKKLMGSIAIGGLNLTDFKEFGWEKHITLKAKYKLFGTSFMASNFEVKLPIHIGDGEIIRDITFSLPTGFGNDFIAFSMLGDLFHLTMRDEIKFDLNFPIALGAQVYGDLWAELETSVGTIEMENEKGQASFNNTWFYEKPELNLNLLYAINNSIDIGANFGADNLKQFKDSIKAGVTVNLRMANLFG